METMKQTERQTIKILCDIGILLTALLAGAVLFVLIGGTGGKVCLGAAVLLTTAAIGDLSRRMRKKPEQKTAPEKKEEMFAVRELVLLNEKNKPLKSWELSGQTALIIGRKNKDEEVDVDLGDCEYGAFVEPQHAVLNFSRERWYLEDISQENGVRVKKAEDGIIYRLAGRPCRVGAGDVIYIANTRLLLT